ncbi:sulfide:quinone oxidoreductase [Sulfuricella denitrificans skB26]|uniref:Sulfide-quinone reductase n=1 Tax=Sulfuricella denitrificans (strain DSM 22764 / NBRC 105220 / skB26) TaxID=1163617 RepID=S6AJA8_SULDS|nr:FAD/NAD(P)-binding oxidoreductase [Sulfuricella denitrificans]BAN34629.1 sulfide:quinone oxidoreductase [Sulfuricella denitrificans skB26]
MAHIVILGAGTGGMTCAYEMREKIRPWDKVTVISDSPNFHFVPSNPWVAVNWRTREDIEIPIAPYFERNGINLIATPAKRVHPKKDQIELMNGQIVDYDFLVIATGPKLAFDEVEGMGPGKNTYSICHVDHAVEAGKAWNQFIRDPGPIVVGAAQGASCFGPAYEFAMIMETDLRRRKIRDQVPMTFITPEPYVGHIGLGGVGDSRGMMESIMRERHIKWICNAMISRVAPGKMFVTELDDMGNVKKEHELPFKHSMILPAFKGVDAVSGIDGLTNQSGFILIDPYQRNPEYDNIYAVGVCVDIPPVESTPVPTGAPKTGYMLESMVSAAVHNICAMLDGNVPDHKATWNAICLADFGDTGAAFVALPQIPPRNVNWFKEGKWVHLAKIAFEKYFLRKMKKGTTEPIYEKYVLNVLGIKKLK